MRREVVYSSAGLYGLESFGTSSSEYKQFVDTFRLSEDTQEWKEGFHDFRHWLYLLPGDAHQIMMMNDYMPTKVNDLYKALLSLG